MQSNHLRIIHCVVRGHREIHNYHKLLIPGFFSVSNNFGSESICFGVSPFLKELRHVMFVPDALKRQRNSFLSPMTRWEINWVILSHFMVVSFDMCSDGQSLVTLVLQTANCRSQRYFGSCELNSQVPFSVRKGFAL